MHSLNGPVGILSGFQQVGHSIWMRRNQSLNGEVAIDFVVDGLGITVQGLFDRFDVTGSAGGVNIG